MINELSQSYKCRYCEKEFRKESTLTAHLCEQKRRWQQEKETGVQFGLRAYLKFYETTQGSARLKSYEDFVTSPYYSAFVRYGRHLVAIRAVNSDSFTSWLLKNNRSWINGARIVFMMSGCWIIFDVKQYRMHWNVR